MRAHHDLAPLAVPVVLCAAAWAAIAACPATPARVHPQAVTRRSQPHRAPRPPTPLAAEAPPAEAMESHTAELLDAPVMAPPTAAEASADPRLFVGEPIAIEGNWGCSFGGDDLSDWEERWRWSPSGLAWTRRFFYYRRALEAHWRAAREAAARRSLAVLADGSATAIGWQGPDAPSLCAVFGSLCAAHSRRAGRASTAPRPADIIPAELRREGRRWTLANALVEATIDPEALCALTVRRPRGEALPALSFATPGEARCTVAETAPFDPAVDAGAVAFAVTWRAEGWWQEVIVSLRDDASSPEASVTRATREGTTVRAEFGNLSSLPLTWTVGGREHTVAPGRVAELRS
jgi:hypothetical protein